MNKQKINTHDLRIGMYVELANSWLAHDFLKSHFKISTPQQLDQLRHMKQKQVTVNFDKSDPATPDQEDRGELPSRIHELPQSTMPTLNDPKYGQLPEQWSSEKLLTDDLRNVLDDQQLGPDEKSVAVYKHSVDMMKKLLIFPTSENIQSSKQAIYAISDMVMADHDTAKNMLMITSHDFYTYTHSVNVGITSILLCKELFRHSEAHDLHELAAGFFLHDLGKVNIDPDVLNKPGRLDDAEMKHVRTHPYQGYKILQAANALSPECSTIVMQHHETFSGNGYPKHLKNREIHLYGRICAIADVFDALTSERSYKKSLKPFEALSLMKQNMIENFDRELFNSFVKMYQ